MSKDKPRNYVENKILAKKLIDFSTIMNKLKEKHNVKTKKELDELGVVSPRVPEDIGLMLFKICERLSHKHNFKDYTWREDMVQDGLIVCLNCVYKYDHTKPTRTGKYNPFSYFTQCAYREFVLTIKRNNKQNDIISQMITNGKMEDYISKSDNNKIDISNSITRIQDFHDRKNGNVIAKDKEYYKTKWDN